MRVLLHFPQSIERTKKNFSNYSAFLFLLQVKYEKNKGSVRACILCKENGKLFKGKGSCLSASENIAAAMMGAAIHATPVGINEFPALFSLNLSSPSVVLWRRWRCSGGKGVYSSNFTWKCINSRKEQPGLGRLKSQKSMGIEGILSYQGALKYWKKEDGGFSWKVARNPWLLAWGFIFLFSVHKTGLLYQNKS